MKREDMVRNLRERKQPWDIAVIGGGATGMGVAVDAAARGFDVVLHTGATRAVEASPGDGERALSELRQAGVQLAE